MDSLDRFTFAELQTALRFILISDSTENTIWTNRGFKYLDQRLATTLARDADHLCKHDLQTQLLLEMGKRPEYAELDLDDD